MDDTQGCYSNMTYDQLVRATPSLRIDVGDPRPMAERFRIHRAIVAEVERRGVLEIWSYDVRMQACGYQPRRRWQMPAPPSSSGRLPDHHASTEPGGAGLLEGAMNIRELIRTARQSESGSDPDGPCKHITTNSRLSAILDHGQYWDDALGRWRCPWCEDWESACEELAALRDEEDSE